MSDGITLAELARRLAAMIARPLRWLAFEAKIRTRNVLILSAPLLGTAILLLIAAVMLERARLDRCSEARAALAPVIEKAEDEGQKRPAAEGGPRGTDPRPSPGNQYTPLMPLGGEAVVMTPADFWRGALKNECSGITEGMFE